MPKSRHLCHTDANDAKCYTDAADATDAKYAEYAEHAEYAEYAKCLELRCPRVVCKYLLIPSVLIFNLKYHEISENT